MSNTAIKWKDQQWVATGGGVGSLADPFLPVASTFSEAVSRGEIPGAYIVHKFGEAADVDAADPEAVVWDGVSSEVLSELGVKVFDYTYSTTADITHLVSSEATDLQDISVAGVTADFTLVIQTVTLSGQTPVPLTTPLMRVFRMKNVTQSLTADIVGNVYCMVGNSVTAGVPNDPTTVRSIIRDEHNQTQQAMFTTPKGYTLFISHGWASLARRANTGSVGLFIRVRSPGSVFRELHKTALLLNGSSQNSRPYTIPIPFPEGTDLQYSCISDTNDMAVSAGFHGLLVPTSVTGSLPATL